MSIFTEIKNSADCSYRDFSAKLIPTIDKETILGVRAPMAKKIAKKYASTKEGNEFLKNLPHKYHDENMVHAYMLGFIKESTEEMHARILEFLPCVENWAVCDSLCASLKFIQNDKDNCLDFVLKALEGEHTYTVRFGLVCLLDYYVNEKYIDVLLGVARETKSEEYYINMALAWLISVMLVKEYDKTLTLLKDGELSLWVHNKSIQKACESYRISDTQKTYLKGLKR